MITVDPAGLASVAQRITAVLAELAAGDPVHPPLGADPATVGAAARLSVAGSALAAVLGAQAAGLAATAEQLVTVAAGFADTDQANAAKIATLAARSDGPAVSGWAPPAAPVPPDARPPLPPPPAVPGETISAAVHAGDPGAGDAFIATWTRVAAAADDAAGVVRMVADTLPDAWDSAVSTPVVRAHLNRYADALAASATRAHTLVAQAGRHVEQTVAARSDIPSPGRFAALRQQLTAVAQANAATGGAYAIPLGKLNSQMTAMDVQAVAGFANFYGATEESTAGEVDLDGDAVPEPGIEDPGAVGGADPVAVAGPPGKAGAEGVTGAVTPEMAGQMAAMLPGMIPMVLGAAGGMVGGAVSMIGKMPETLAQVGTQAIGAATQSLSSLMKPATDDFADAGDVAGLDDPLNGDGVGGAGGGGAGTTPAGGGTVSAPPSVAPSTGAPPAPPPTPAGGLPSPVTPSTGPSGTGMMPMPLGGMPGAGAGPGGQDRPLRSKDVVVPLLPHAESVTGKISAARIAVSATAPDTDEPPPGDDDHSSTPRPIVRRITTATPRDDE